MKKNGLIKDNSGGKIMTNFVELRVKIDSYLIDDDSEDEKVKGTKKCVIKGKLKFKSYENCLKVNQYSNKIKNLEKNKIGIDSIRKIRMNLYETINYH